MTLGEVLFKRLRELGAEHVFGVPGDFALPLFEAADESGVEVVQVTHEPSAGFAADAYARVKGLGAVCVTYCVGGLNITNPIAGTYAEKSPVIVISGDEKGSTLPDPTFVQPCSPFAHVVRPHE